MNQEQAVHPRAIVSAGEHKLPGTGSSTELERQLVNLVRQTPWFTEALRAVRDLNLQSWCIGAGAVRNLVWDHLHGFASPSQLPDIDVAYFDASDVSPEHDLRLQLLLEARRPGVPWEVTNQAGVHHWFEAHFGHAVDPLGSLEEAIASWPEYATAVGVCLLPDGSFRVIAPYGLGDLFGMVVRRNPARVDVATYRQRVEQKRYNARWPHVRVEQL